MAKKSGKFRGILGLIGLILIGIGAFALYDFVSQLFYDFWAIFGVTSPYIVLGSMIFSGLVVLFLSGYDIVKGLRRLAS